MGVFFSIKRAIDCNDGRLSDLQKLCGISLIAMPDMGKPRIFLYKIFPSLQKSKPLQTQRRDYLSLQTCLALDPGSTTGWGDVNLNSKLECVICMGAVI